MHIVLRYGPSAIEILEPEEITLSKAEIDNMLADVSAMVHGLTTKVFELMSARERTKTLEDNLKLKNANTSN
jgi:hypothetical protein